MTAKASPTPTGKPPAPAPAQRGFTYVSLIILVALLGLVGAASLKLGAVLRRSAAEQELLNIGAQFSDALQSYANATPPGQPVQPPSLKELLKDPRFPNTRRHLRKLFVDPITGKAEWGVMTMAGETGVLGVYSLSNAKPVKIANFPARFQGFDGKLRLSDWKFARTGHQPSAAAPGQPAKPGHPPPGAAPPGPAPQQAEPAPEPEDAAPPSEPEPEPPEPAAPAKTEP